MSRVPPEVAEAVIARSGGFCEAATSRCRGTEFFPARGEALHHRKLRKQGGPHTEDNMMNVCLNCHLHIHDQPTESYEQGWLVKSTAEITPYMRSVV